MVELGLHPQTLGSQARALKPGLFSSHVGIVVDICVFCINIHSSFFPLVTSSEFSLGKSYLPQPTITTLVHVIWVKLICPGKQRMNARGKGPPVLNWQKNNWFFPSSVLQPLVLSFKKSIFRASIYPSGLPDKDEELSSVLILHNQGPCVS